MSIKNLLYWSYWFSQPYIARGNLFNVWLGAFLVLIFTGLVALIIRSFSREAVTRRALGDLSSGLITMGLIALLWLFFRQERVVVLAWRFWLLPWLGVTVWWLGKSLRYLVWRLPKIKAQNAERALKQKYLAAK